MEKIYIEENQKKKTNTRLSISVGLSFGVAFIAIVSILFVSLSGTTYSLPSVTPLPDKITTEAANTEMDAGQANGYGVHLLKAKDLDTPVYCVESNVDYLGGKELTKKDEITDEAFIYLLTKIETMTVDGSKLTATDGYGNQLTTPLSNEEKAKLAKYYVGQTAIWRYLAATKTDLEKQKADYKNESDFNSKCLSAKELRINPTGENNKLSSGEVSFYKLTGMDEVLKNAITAHEKNSSDILSLDISKASDKFEVKDKYLKSDKITVKFGEKGLITENDDEYSLTLTNAPEGTKVYGITKQGKEEEVKDLTKLSYKELNQFYLYVPADKVKGTIKFSLKVNGSFQVYTGYYYRDLSSTTSAAQTVTTVKLLPKPKNDNVDFSITKAPDTGTDVSSIMYIVGMVVLLSGLGILYVNIKNQKQYQ